VTGTGDVRGRRGPELGPNSLLGAFGVGPFHRGRRSAVFLVGQAVSMRLKASA
jgi:hypothetical protein